MTDELLFSGSYVPGKIKTGPDNWLDVFNVIPVICFGYQVGKALLLNQDLTFCVGYRK